jgi:multidrug efflux pump
VVKSTKNFLMIIGLVSEDGSLDRNALTDYMVSNLQDIISRVEGVGELQQSSVPRTPCGSG